MDSAGTVFLEVAVLYAEADGRVRILFSPVLILAAHQFLLDQRIHEVGSPHCPSPALKEALYIVNSPPASGLAGDLLATERSGWQKTQRGL